MKNFWICTNDRPIAGPYADPAELEWVKRYGLDICCSSLGGRLSFGLRKPEPLSPDNGINVTVANDWLLVGRIGAEPAIFGVDAGQPALNEFGNEEPLSWAEAYERGLVFVTDEGQPYINAE